MLLLLLLAASPLQILKNGSGELQTLVAKADTTTDQLAAKADGFIDFAELARRSLGAHWAKLKPAQQVELIGALKAVLKASYATQVLGQGKPTSSTVWGEEKITGDEAVVKSTVEIAGERVPVDYRLFRKDAKAEWRVYDVVTDGVSLIDAYADQFRAVIAKKGIDGLLETLKKRRAQLEAPGTKHATAH